MKIETPCSTYTKGEITKIKDRLGDVIAVCNDPATADEIIAHINDTTDADTLREKILDELFT